jgi:hypothetical protein
VRPFFYAVAFSVLTFAQVSGVHTARLFLQVQLFGIVSFIVRLFFYAVAFSMLTFVQTSLNVVLPTLPLSTSFHTYPGSSFAGATLRDHFLYCEAVLLCSCVFGANFCADVFKCCSTLTNLLFHFLIFLDRRPCFIRHLNGGEKHAYVVLFVNSNAHINLVLLCYIDTGANTKRQTSILRHHCTFLPVFDRLHAPLLL